MKVRDLARLLEDDGWGLVRTRGSHKQFKHPRKSGTVRVAGKAGVAVGETRNEVVQLIREAIDFHIEGLRQDGLPAPPSSSESEFVEVSAA